MNDCPNWVAGRLFIAGEGLARGYWKDRKERRKDSSIIQLLMRDCIIPVI